MYKLKSPDVYASEIAAFLNGELKGRDFIVKRPASAESPREQSFIYANGGEKVPSGDCRDILILTKDKGRPKHGGISFVVVENPRIAFIKVINEFYIEFDPVRIAASAKIDAGARMGRGVSVGENAVIGSEVSVGKNTTILNNVTITGRVAIGDGCLIKDNSTIGSEGYDFEREEDGNLLHFPHLGRILIGGNVWIGANSSIETPAIDDTIIEDGVKIDDLVQIGANCVIGAKSMITAGVVVSRNVEIGKNCLLAPNASVRESIKVGDNTTLGIGAVAVKDLEKDSVYAGNPARLLKRR